MNSNFPIVPHYQLVEQLYDGSRTRVYRGTSENSQKPVIVKILRNPHPNFHELVQFRNQYAIAHHLEHPAIVRPLALERYGNSYALVMSDDGAKSLRDYWQPSQRNLSEFLSIAIQLAQALHYLAQKHIIHKDIKPANILIHPETRQVQLIDFSISSLLPREQQQLINPNILEGTLAYISPEQTGRMNRGIDYRTDFYSLGVTFFELLTGKLPFATSDPMELVHCHIAKRPPTLGNPEEIPPVLSDIIMKLMAKNAEDRYQSALGLQHDLERCQQQWETTGEIMPFVLGERDVCDRFLIPEKLYGREAEVTQLLAAFERVSQGDGEKTQHSELILIAGFSGIGKTALVNEVHKPIVRQRGCFIKGKFDQFKRNIPFSAFVQAFRNLMEQLLGESDAELTIWKAKILSALGNNGQVIIEVIPELEQITGKQPPVPKLSGSAAQNRFNLLFGKFVRVFAAKEHPLVIFLDDLQWADSASVNLLKLLIEESETGYLLIVGAYRDNEVFPAHSLMLALAELEKNNAIISSITLEPLALNHINRLVAETLSCHKSLAQPLTELVYQKTQGNPFFTTQFLKGLYEDELIVFNRDLGYWECDLVRVRDAALTDDVVEFMAQRLQKLPEATQEVLKLAACIGNQFALDTLAVVCEESQEEVAVKVWFALQEGLILPISEAYKFFQGGVEETTANIVTVGYRFLHDRVQQAAYSLISEEKKQETHFKIGKLLLINTPKVERNEKIFEIVSQLNYGAGLISNEAEIEELTQLNLQAGAKAKTSTAYIAAIEYFTQGLNLVKTNWHNYYELTLSFYNELADCNYLIADFDLAESYTKIILDGDSNLIDKIKAYELRILIYTAQLSMNKAINTGLEILKNLEIDLESSLPENLVIEDLINLERMDNIYAYSAMRILMQILAPAYVTGADLLYKLTSTMIRLSMDYGNCEISAFGYTVHALLLAGRLNQIEMGYQYGQLALKVLDKLEAKEMKSKVLNGFNAHVIHWKEHIRNSWNPLQESIESGLEVGDIQYACHSATNYCEQLFFGGHELDLMCETYAQYIELTKYFKQEHSISEQSIWGQVCLNLSGKGEDKIELKGHWLNENEVISTWKESNNTALLFMFYTAKTMLSFLMRENKAAILNAKIAAQSIEGVTGLMAISCFNFYYSLALLAESFSEAEIQKKYLEQVCDNQKQLGHWAVFAPTNFQHKYNLVEAEKYRILGRNVEAMELYDRAIQGAKENEYIQEEALANELAALFYLNWDKEKIAATYMQEAYYCYARWGAKAKTNQLEKKYPQLLVPILNSQIRPQKNEIITRIGAETIVSTSTRTSESLDLATVIKASQALSENINLDTLLSNLMQVAMENAGATRGTLILEQARELVIVSQYSEQSCHLQTTLIEDSSNLPASLIHYGWRTQETLVFNEANIPTQFAADPYIIEHQPKSLLCLPLQKQGVAIALLYLENTLTAEAFASERVEVLKILAAQAAISLENARLYKELADYSQTLEEKVTERTRELSDTLEQLKATQDELIQQEKMAALGQLVAGVAHEVNTPLGAIRSSIGYIADFIEQKLDQLPAFFQNLPRDRAQDFFVLLQRSRQHFNPLLSSREKRQIKRQLTRQLEAKEIAHAHHIADTLVDLSIHQEIEVFLPLLQDPNSQQILDTAYQLVNVRESAHTIATATDKAAKVVFALKTYARYDPSTEKVEAQVTEGLETVLTLYNSQLKQGIEVIRCYEDNLPPILCYPDELNQVWTNLIHNAIQAMDYRGTLTVDVRQENARLCIGITDSGMGIPPEIHNQIFQPFFTTKPPGEGSGLGLDIVRKIVDKHHGKIEFESAPGCTTFRVYLPVRSTHPLDNICSS
jgi:predicted ATPase/signal transduction histidine kinase